MDALYRKSLRVSSAAKGDLGAGKIVNLQSNDAGERAMRYRSAAAGRAVGSSRNGAVASTASFPTSPLCSQALDAANLFAHGEHAGCVPCALAWLAKLGPAAIGPS